MIEIIKALGSVVIALAIIVAITAVLWMAIKHRFPVSLRLKVKDVDFEAKCGSENAEGSKETPAT